MAADACYTEEDMHLARAEGLDLEPLELSSVKEVKQWIRSRGGVKNFADRREKKMRFFSH